MRELKIKNLTWLSLINPQRKELEEVKANLPELHPRIWEELLLPTVRAKVEEHEKYLYLVLHFPDFSKESPEGKSTHQEIDFILLPHTLLTVQYDDHNLLEKFWNENWDESIEEHYSQSPALFLYYLIRGYFHSLAKEMDQVQLRMEKLEEKVFAGQEREVLKEAALLRKDLLDCRRILGPQRHTLESLSVTSARFYGERIKPILEELPREYLKVWNILESHKETLDSLYETNNSLLAIKTNSAIKNLTLIALMTFIPMTVAGLFGMNVFGAPFTKSANGFWMVVVLIILFTLGVYLFLRWKKLV